MLSLSLISVFFIIYVPSRYSLLCLRSGLHPMSSCMLAFKLSTLRFRFMFTQCSLFHPLMFTCIISWFCLIPICLVLSSSSAFSCPICFVSYVLVYVVCQCYSVLLICYMISFYNSGCRVFLLYAHSRMVFFKFIYSAFLPFIVSYMSYRKSSS